MTPRLRGVWNSDFPCRGMVAKHGKGSLKGKQEALILPSKLCSLQLLFISNHRKGSSMTHFPVYMSEVFEKASMIKRNMEVISTDFQIKMYLVQIPISYTNF